MLINISHVALAMCSSFLLLLVSIIFTNTMLFWVGVSALFISVYVALIAKCIRTSRKVLILLIFVFAIRICFSIRDYLYDGSLLLPQDTSYSLQLVRTIRHLGRIDAGIGTGMAKSYSYFPIPIIFSSVFVTVSGLSDVLFASLLYPTFTSLTAIALLFVLYQKIFSLIKLRHAEHIAILGAFVFTLSVRFFSLYRQFRLENLAFIFLVIFLIAIVSELKHLNKLNRQYLILTIISVTLIPLSHATTENILLLFLFSALIIMKATKFKITPLLRWSNHVGWKSLKRYNSSLLLALVLICAVTVNVTWKEYSLSLKSLSQNVLFSFLGRREVGLSKFNPYDYSLAEIYLVILGSAALGMLVVFSLFRFYREKNEFISRFFQFQILVFTVFGIYVIYFSPFRVTVFERGYFYILLFSSICISWFLTRTKRKIKTVALVMLLLFFTSQFIIRHQYLEIVDKPLILKSNIVFVTERFADFAVFRKGNVALLPRTRLSTFAALNKLNSIGAVKDVIFNTEHVVQESDYILIYDSDEKILNSSYPPDIHDALKETISFLESELNLVYSQGHLVIFKGK